jgi:hypothetical protein
MSVKLTEPQLSALEKIALRAGFTTVADYISTAVAERAFDDVPKYFFTDKEREELYEQLQTLKPKRD